jgi:glyceraldehyde 3-phosphate dehydrogenase
MANVAINGLGRIGRTAFKILMDVPELNLVAVNDLIPEDNLAYLLNYDSVHGGCRERVTHAEGALNIKDQRVRVYHEKDPARLPWKQHAVDLVFECTGVFRKKSDLQKHLSAGAGHVILSAPAKSDGIEMVVHGVNRPQADSHMVSCASCTTNCITPVVEVLDRRLGVHKAVMTTIHAYTASQSIVDGPRNKWRRGRAAAVNFVPTSTGAAKATTFILPGLGERFAGVAVRGPVPAGSLADIVLLVKRKTSIEEVNGFFREEAESERYDCILGVAEDPIVSSDILRDSHASIVDLTMTQVVDGDLVKVMSWYDNEWGYTAQMIREAVRMLGETRTG